MGRSRRPRGPSGVLKCRCLVLFGLVRASTPQRDAKVRVRIQASSGRWTSSTQTTWGAMTNRILALKEQLTAQQVTVVVMVVDVGLLAPVHYPLEADFEVLPVKARDVTNVSGRKIDVSDAARLAGLGAHGLRARCSWCSPTHSNSVASSLVVTSRSPSHATGRRGGRTRFTGALERLVQQTHLM